MNKSLSYDRGSAIRKFMVVLLTALFCIASSVSVFANVSTEAASISLTTSVYSKMSSNTYELEGGGYISGKELFTGSAAKGYDLDEAKFGLLTSDAQTIVVEDIATYSNEKVGENGVTEQTVQNWWKQLQTKNGVGSKFLNTILENTKPDFVTANAIYKPFSGPVGTVMGLLAVAMMGFLGVVMVADICYITLPPVRLFVADDEKGDKLVKSKIFSHDALYAVQKAESDSDSGSPKQALGIYLKRRIFMLIILGICLMYLVQGQIYTAVGYILDLVSGFLGF